MDKIYNAKKIYIVQLAKVTGVVPSGWRTEGETRYRVSEKLYFAKLIAIKDKGWRGETRTYKLISNGLVVGDNHEKTKVGDYFINEASPMNLVLERNYTFVTKKELIEAEEYYNSLDEKTIEENK